MKETAVKTDWLRIFSPFIITSILTLFAIVESMIQLQKSGGWSMIEIIVGLPFLVILLTIDLLIKSLSKATTTFIWLTELGLITILVFSFLKLIG